MSFTHRILEGDIKLVPPFVEGDGKDGAVFYVFVDCDGLVPTSYDVITNADITQQILVKSTFTEDVDDELYEQHAILTCTLATPNPADSLIFDPEKPYMHKMGWVRPKPSKTTTR